jgi:hypothetical protein
MDHLDQVTGEWVLTHPADDPKIYKILSTTALVTDLLDHLAGAGGASLSDFLQTIDLGGGDVGAGAPAGGQ